jgi:RNA polymerase sigma-70 factor (ECF subfamily)
MPPDATTPNAPPEPLTDTLAAARAGDEEAFSGIVREHHRRIHSLAYRMTGSIQDADDLAQETFLRAWRQLRSFRGDSSLATWLHRIALHLSLNWRERASSRQRTRDAYEAESRPTAHGGDDGGDLEAERNRRVVEALQRLKPDFRAAIVLTVYEGLNHAEAASRLGCAETTVSWRVWRGRRMLRAWLADLMPRSAETKEPHQ